MGTVVSEVVQHNADGNDPEPGSRAAAVFSLVLTQFSASVFKEIEKYCVVEVFEVLVAERDALGSQGALNTMVNQA